ncbi:hypothetical protein M7I_0892 [Glarea lozoyensis 74030]|uniref:Uncharacterized protein n=1 Tax=Glarea lozoyensis (strain ATCC 74030 / MF5533) TaxID=1104152 RepID=H0EEL2_GLAL7|nr:hypothetical protein M7I_0892 [Glarea lozoyensis 74030]
MSQQSGIWGRTNTHNPFEVAGGLYMVEKDQEVDMRNLPAILNPTIERPVIEHMKVTHNVRPLARTV